MALGAVRIGLHADHLLDDVADLLEVFDADRFWLFNCGSVIFAGGGREESWESIHEQVGVVVEHFKVEEAVGESHQFEPDKSFMEEVVELYLSRTQEGKDPEVDIEFSHYQVQQYLVIYIAIHIPFMCIFASTRRKSNSRYRSSRSSLMMFSISTASINSSALLPSLPCIETHTS